jgi:hypothetical protein
MYRLTGPCIKFATVKRPFAQELKLLANVYKNLEKVAVLKKYITLNVNLI